LHRPVDLETRVVPVEGDVPPRDAAQLSPTQSARRGDFQGKPVRAVRFLDDRGDLFGRERIARFVFDLRRS
jgi:hypothetical protein